MNLIYNYKVLKLAFNHFSFNRLWQKVVRKDCLTVSYKVYIIMLVMYVKIL